MARDKVFRTAVILGSIALVIVVVEKVWQFGQSISGLLGVLAGAWLLALVLRPFIHYLRELGVPRPVVGAIRSRFGDGPARRVAVVRLPYVLAVSIVYVTALLLVLGLVTVGVATLIGQIQTISARLPELSSTLPAQIRALWLSLSAQFGLEPNAINLVISPEEVASQIRQSIGSIAQQTLSLAAGTANLVWQVFLVLILSYFITTEGRLLRRQFSLLIPRAWQETLQAGFAAMDRSFAGYLRGYFFAAMIRGGIALLVTTLFQISFGEVLALQYALLSFIPLLGSPVGILIAAIITLIVRPAATLPVTLILIVVDQVVAYGILPRILKTTVGVPGLVGLVAVSIGVQLFSFWGLIFSIPVVGAIYALIFDFYLPRQRRGASASEAVAGSTEEASRRMDEEALSSPATPATQAAAAPGRSAR